MSRSELTIDDAAYSTISYCNVENLLVVDSPAVLWDFVIDENRISQAWMGKSGEAHFEWLLSRTVDLSLRNLSTLIKISVGIDPSINSFLKSCRTKSGDLFLWLFWILYWWMIQFYKSSVSMISSWIGTLDYSAMLLFYDTTLICCIFVKANRICSKFSSIVIHIIVCILANSLPYNSYVNFEHMLKHCYWFDMNDNKMNFEALISYIATQISISSRN